MKGTAMDQTASRKTQKFWTHFFQKLHQISAQTVLSVLICMCRKQGYKIKLHTPAALCRHSKSPLSVIKRSPERELVFFPLIRNINGLGSIYVSCPGTQRYH